MPKPCPAGLSLCPPSRRDGGQRGGTAPRRGGKCPRKDERRKTGEKSTGDAPRHSAAGRPLSCLPRTAARGAHSAARTTRACKKRLRGARSAAKKGGVCPLFVFFMYPVSYRRESRNARGDQARTRIARTTRACKKRLRGARSAAKKGGVCPLFLFYVSCFV